MDDVDGCPFGLMIDFFCNKKRIHKRKKTLVVNFFKKSLLTNKKIKFVQKNSTQKNEYFHTFTYNPFYHIE